MWSWLKSTAQLRWHLRIQELKEPELDSAHIHASATHAAGETAGWFNVLTRRQFWKPGQGGSDSALFLPLVGHIEGASIPEVGWLTF
jgi:hypothetical protein